VAFTPHGEIVVVTPHGVLRVSIDGRVLDKLPRAAVESRAHRRRPRLPRVGVDRAEARCVLPLERRPCTTRSSGRKRSTRSPRRSRRSDAIKAGRRGFCL
jgi:hypothetical protein